MSAIIKPKNRSSIADRSSTNSTSTDNITNSLVMREITVVLDKEDVHLGSSPSVKSEKNTLQVLIDKIGSNAIGAALLGTSVATLISATTLAGVIGAIIGGIVGLSISILSYKKKV